jgi:integrase
LIATLTYSFARITAALKMKVEDLWPRGAGWTVRLHEKGGKQHAMPCHHALAEALRDYIDAAGIVEDRKGCCSAPHGATTAMKPAGRLADDPPARRGGRQSQHRSAATPFARPGSPPTSPMAAHSSACRKWPHTRARARPNSTTAPRSGLPRTKWNKSDCEIRDSSPPSRAVSVERCRAPPFGPA